jgi:hypothetical protein
VFHVFNVIDTSLQGGTGIIFVVVYTYTESSSGTGHSRQLLLFNENDFAIFMCPNACDLRHDVIFMCQTRFGIYKNLMSGGVSSGSEVIAGPIMCHIT